MVKWLDDCALDVAIQLANIDNHPGFGVNWPGNRDLDNVVMAMTVRIAALAIHSPVFRFIEMGAVQPM